MPPLYAFQNTMSATHPCTTVTQMPNVRTGRVVMSVRVERVTKAMALPALVSNHTI